MAPRFPSVSRGVERESSKNPAHPTIGFTREGDRENPCHAADRSGYAPTLARVQRDPTEPDVGSTLHQPAIPVNAARSRVSWIRVKLARIHAGPIHWTLHALSSSPCITCRQISASCCTSAIFGNHGRWRLVRLPSTPLRPGKPDTDFDLVRAGFEHRLDTGPEANRSEARDGGSGNRVAGAEIRVG